MRLEPFRYQLDAIDQLRAGFARGFRRGLLVMQMAAGKTVASLELMRLSAEKGRRSVFLCDRRMLADQALGVAISQGLNAGIIMAGKPTDHNAPCQFASKQTILSWSKRQRLDLGTPDLVIVDEAHRATGPSWLDLYARWPKAYFVGLTATPVLGNGDGMGAYYDFLVAPITPSQLREMGRLVPVRAFAPYVPDLAGVKRGADGDYSVPSLSERMNRANLIGDVVGWWTQLGENRPSVYFCCDQAHAMSVVQEFRANGIAADMIVDDTSDEDRAAIKARSRSGELKVIANVDCLAEGVDFPWISCIGLVRPTKRLRRYLQNAGRGLRADNSGDHERIMGKPKKDCIIIDHAGCVLYHGFPDIDREWPLSENDNADRINQSRQKQASTITCVKCSAVFSGSRRCPECGWMHVIERVAKDYARSAGTLVEIAASDMDSDASKIEMSRFWGRCIGTAIKRGAKAAMAASMFANRFKVPPWSAKVAPLPSDRGAWKLPAREVFPGFVRGGLF